MYTWLRQKCNGDDQVLDSIRVTKQIWDWCNVIIDLRDEGVGGDWRARKYVGEDEKNLDFVIFWRAWKGEEPEARDPNRRRRRKSWRNRIRNIDWRRPD